MNATIRYSPYLSASVIAASVALALGIDAGRAEEERATLADQCGQLCLDLRPARAPAGGDRSPS
jgi:hypothetical protein